MVSCFILIEPDNKLERILLYQKLSLKVKELHLLGVPCKKMAKTLNINKKTAIKACLLFKTLESIKYY